MEGKLAMRVEDERVFVDFNFNPNKVAAFYITMDEGIKYLTLQIDTLDYSILYDESICESLKSVVNYD